MKNAYGEKDLWYESEIGWVICGGESGSKARSFDVEWARDLLFQCQAADVPFFMKQFGAHPYSVALDEDGREVGVRQRLVITDRKGGDIEEFPDDLCVRELPEVEL